MTRSSRLSWLLSVLAVMALLLTACGGSSSGGSGSGDPDDPEPDDNTASIGGTAEGPAGMVAELNHGPLDRILAFVAGEAVAAVTGLQPVGNATVELVRLDDEGKVTQVIDSTQTSSTGDYVFSLDEEVDLTGNLAVRVDSAANLRAQVTGSEDVRVDPVSELVLRKLIEARAQLGSVTTSQVVALRGKVDAVDINLDEVADLEAAIAEIDAIAGDTLQSDARNIVEGDGDAAAVAGDWYRVMMARELGPNNTEAESEHGPIELVAGDGADLTAEIGVVEHQSAFTDTNGALDLSTRVDDEGDTFSGVTVTGEGVIVFDNPVEELPPEDMDGTFDVFAPKTVRLATAGDLAAALSASVRLQYEALDTDDDGNPDTRGDLVQINRGMVLDLFGRAQSGTTAEDLAGGWGVVRQYLELEASGGKIEINTLDDLEMDADGAGSDTLSFGTHNVTEIDLFASAGENTVVTEAGEDALPFKVESDGALTILGFLNGFVTADSNVFVVAGLELDEEADPEALIGKSVLVGVRRNGSGAQPDVANRSFRYVGYLTEVDGNGTTLLQHSEGLMEFGGSADTLSITGVSEREIERNSVGGEATAESRQIDLFENASITVATNGGVSTNDSIQLATGVNVDLDGFVAPGGEIVVLAASFDDPDGGAGSGLIIGLPLAEAE